VPSIRPPQIGQQWVYNKINQFTGKVQDQIIESVEIISQQITISRSDQAGAKLASEIQSSWGVIASDPHWGRVQNYSPAIPLWPEQMSASWSKQFSTRYSIAGFPENSFTWQQYMYCAG